jgi:hypothetical protein
VVTIDRSPTGLVDLYSALGREISVAADRAGALAEVCRVAVRRVPGTQWASITEGRDGAFVTVAATDDVARAVDEIQYELGTGPCVDAIRQDVTFRTDDLAADDRWPVLGRLAAERHQVRSVLSFRLYLEDDDRITSLNLYSTRTAAFGDSSEVLGTLVATHGALAVSAATAREQAAQLQVALDNSRRIGMAMGVLMATHKITRDQAFALLRIVSQNTNRKLADIAGDVVETGVLLLPPGRSGPGA